MAWQDHIAGGADRVRAQGTADAVSLQPKDLKCLVKVVRKALQDKYKKDSRLSLEHLARATVATNESITDAMAAQFVRTLRAQGVNTIPELMVFKKDSVKGQPGAATTVRSPPES